MARRKKNNSLQIEENEVVMTDSAVMENETENKEQVLDAVQVELDLARLDLERTKLEIAQQKHELELLKNAPTRRQLDPEEQQLHEKHLTMGHERTTLKDKLDKQKAYDNVLVTGRFINRHRPGQPIKLPYIKHEGDPVKWWPFEDGKVYTIPRGFADQLNGGTENDPCYYTPKFVQKPGEMNPDSPSSAIHSVDRTHNKYQFVPVGF